MRDIILDIQPSYFLVDFQTGRMLAFHLFLPRSWNSNLILFYILFDAVKAFTVKALRLVFLFSSDKSVEQANLQNKPFQSSKMKV